MEISSDENQYHRLTAWQKPVSYTHLDVYKRQTYSFACGTMTMLQIMIMAMTTTTPMSTYSILVLLKMFLSYNGEFYGV